MTDFIEKHSIKIKLVSIFSVIGFIIFWTFTTAGYIYTVENNSRNIEKNISAIQKLDDKLSKLATKEDLQIFKQDIKDFLK